MRAALELSMAPEPERTDEHKIGALLLALASISAAGYVEIRRAGRAWGVTAHDPRQRASVIATGETLREALEGAWALLRRPTRT